MIEQIVPGDCRHILVKQSPNIFDLIVTSPPYNCQIGYDNYTDEVPWCVWYSFMEDTLMLCHEALRPGGVLAVVIPWAIRWQRNHYFSPSWADFNGDRGRIEPVGVRLWEIMEKLGYKVREPIIWVKSAPGGPPICSDFRMGSDNNPYMRSCSEVILLASKHRWHHDGGTGRRGAEAVPFLDYTKDVWHIPTTSSPDHPAPFPLEIPWRLIQLFIHRENTQDLPHPVVCDPFCGIGTTLIAADRMGYGYFGCDLSQKYVERARLNIQYDRFARAQMTFEEMAEVKP